MRVTLNPEYTLTEYADGRFCAETDEGLRIALRAGEAMCLLAAPDTVYSAGNTFYEGLCAKGLLVPGNDTPSIHTRPYVYRNSAEISVTSRCNCRCPHCYTSAENGEGFHEMSVGQIAHLLDECLSVGIRNVELIGGEPLTHPHFNEILREIKLRNMRLDKIYTNALLIDGKLLGTLRSLDFEPQFDISFDGLGTYDQFRGTKDGEAKVLAVLDLLKAQGFHYCCNVNVNRMTLPRLMETADYLANVKGADLRFLWTAPTPRWQKNGESLSYGVYFDACLAVIRAAVEGHWPCAIKCFFMPGLPKDHDMRAVFQAWHRAFKPSHGATCFEVCGKATNQIYIACDGRVLPCPPFEGISKVMNIMTDDGVNVLKTPLRRILETSSYHEPYKVTLEQLAAREAKCRECKWLGICRGGCRCFSILRGFDTAVDIECVFYTGGYADKLEAIFTEDQAKNRKESTQ